jgi:hypothetical protein
MCAIIGRCKRAATPALRIPQATPRPRVVSGRPVCGNVWKWCADAHAGVRCAAARSPAATNTATAPRQRPQRQPAGVVDVEHRLRVVAV